MKQITILVLFLAVWSSSQALAEDKRLTDARSRYKTLLKKIDSRRTNDTNTWPKEFLTALTALQGSFRKSGDLDGLIAVKSEIDRFKKTTSITEMDIVDVPASLADLQRKYFKAGDSESIQQHKDVIALYTRYVGHLERLKTTLTKEGKIPDALAVRDELKDASEDPRVMAAEFAMTTLDGPGANEPGGITGPGRRETPGRSAEPTAESDPNAITAGYKTTPNTRIHSVGKRPRMGKLRYSRFSLTDTRNAALANRTFTVSAERGTLKEKTTGPIGSSSSSTYLSSSYEQKHTTLNTHIRLHVRAATKNKMFPDMLAVVEHYSQPAQKSKGKITPRKHATQYVRLPVMDSRSRTVDFPATTTLSTRYRYSGYRTWHMNGHEFAGVVISVFSGDGTLVFQGASERALLDQARTTLPRRVVAPPPTHVPAVTLP